MGIYEADRKWSDSLMARACELIGPHLLVESPFKIDTEQASDLVILTGRDVQVAVRLRRHGYARFYPHDFTIRSHRDSGAKTELAKIIDGFADWMFYGHANADSTDIDTWMLLNLDIFRACLIRQKDDIKFTHKSNYDGTEFLAFDVRSFDPRIIIARGGEQEKPTVATASAKFPWDTAA